MMTPRHDRDQDTEPNPTNHHCQNCGAHVSERYAAVFGDNQNIVHECKECATGTEVHRGGAAGKNPSRGSLSAVGVVR